MKNGFLIVFVIFNGFISFGQVDKPILKGNFSFGGSIGFSATSQTTDKKNEFRRNEFNFSPSVGYFFMDRLIIGISPILSFSKGINTHYQSDSMFNLRYNNSSTIRSLGLAPYVKYYFTNGLFVTANLKYSKNLEKTDSEVEGYAVVYNPNTPNYYSETISNYNYGSLAYGFGVGYAYFINSKVAIDCSLNYQREKQLISGDMVSIGLNASNYSSKDISINLTKSMVYMSIGFSIFL